MLVFGLSRRGHSAAGLEVEKLNDKYRERSRKLRAAMLPKAGFAQERSNSKNSTTRKSPQRDEKAAEGAKPVAGYSCWISRATSARPA
jgi:hypothetical protein